MAQNSHPERLRKHFEDIQGTNLIGRGWAQGRSMDELGLTTKYPLSNILRVGFLAIIGFIGFGFSFMLSGAIKEIRDDEEVVASSIMLCVGLCGVLIALRGIWRVWWDVFRRDVKEDHFSNHYITQSPELDSEHKAHRETEHRH